MTVAALSPADVAPTPEEVDLTMEMVNEALRSGRRSIDVPLAQLQPVVARLDSAGWFVTVAVFDPFKGNVRLRPR